MKNYYLILEIKPEASKDEIKKAFRRLALIHHPDKGGDENKFKEINEAYAFLSSKQKIKQPIQPYQPYGAYVIVIDFGFGGCGWNNNSTGSSYININL